MYTFNLGLVFGKADHVIIIVCGSQEPIDRMEVNRVATKHFQQAIRTSETVQSVIRQVVDGIRAECSCNAVTVTADATCMIPRADDSLL